MDHLMGMRRYLLLGQGDFIRHLMDLLAEDLEKPANLLYMHNLTGKKSESRWFLLCITLKNSAKVSLYVSWNMLESGTLETAIRATNAQYDNQEILKRLDARLLQVR